MTIYHSEYYQLIIEVANLIFIIWKDNEFAQRESRQDQSKIVSITLRERYSALKTSWEDCVDVVCWNLKDIIKAIGCFWARTAS